VQFSRETEVLHLAPMTSIGLRAPLENRTPQQDATTRPMATNSRPGGPGRPVRCTTCPATGSTIWLQLCQGTTRPASPTLGVVTLGLHRSTAIPDNRDIDRRHPPASRSGINRAQPRIAVNWHNVLACFQPVGVGCTHARFSGSYTHSLSPTPAVVSAMKDRPRRLISRALIPRRAADASAWI
jgi:hypothetical protein